MKIFTFPSAFRCYALDSDRILHIHDVNVTGLRFKDGKAALENYAAMILKNQKIVEFLAPLSVMEGYVTEIVGDRVYANLISVADTEGEEYEATLPREAIVPGDWEKLCEGALFTMLIGHSLMSDGQRGCKVTFVLPPPYSKSELDRMAREFEALWGSMRGFTVD